MKYLITAGGTGGHINPAIALSEELIKNGHEVIFVASKNKIDYDILNSHNLNVKHYYLKGFLRSKNPIKLIKNAINVLFLFKVMIQTYILIKKNKIDYVVGFGGFITFPILKVASFLKIKTAIHEQNSFPGLANRQASKFVDKIFYTYESSKKYFDDTKLIYTSNPCIDEAKKYKNVDKKEYVVFMGGSLGAEKINDLAIDFANTYKIKTILIAGKRYAENYQSNEFVEIIDYVDNPYPLLSEAKLVVARGGATTLLELVAMNANALIIPSPNVVNDHQNINAQELKAKGYVSVFDEKVVTAVDVFEQYNNKNTVEHEFEIDSLKTICEELNG